MTFHTPTPPPPQTPAPPTTPLELIISTPPENHNSQTKIPTPSQEVQSYSDPITKIFLDNEMAKAVLAFVVPMTTLHTTVTSQDTSPVLRSFTLLSLSVGFTTLWLGMSYREKYPRVADAAVQIGTACIFLPFFAAIASLLPVCVAWIPWVCFVASILPFVESYFPRR